MDNTTEFGSEAKYPNEALRNLLERKTIRRFLGTPIDTTTLNWIVEAGLRAPSSGGAQAPMLLVCDDREVNEKLGAMSRSLYNEGLYPVSKSQPSIADDPSIGDAFYGAPTVIHVFAPAGYSYSPCDAAMSACYMMLAAWSFGVGSCYVSRADQLFTLDEPRAIAREHGIPDDFEGACHVCLGYPESLAHTPKPLYPGRLHRLG